ncbi:hypothetical protein BH10PSE7_BH10PSE7_08330 [soil metagenome]
MAIKIGTSADEVLSGTALLDLIIGGSGNDTIKSGDGNDSIFAGFGNDRISAGGGRLVVDGGAGVDRVDLAEGPWAIAPPSFANLSILINLATGQRVALRNIEKVAIGDTLIDFKVGSDRGETLNGTVKADFIEGRGGNDKITSADGNDSISSGGGKDTVSTGGGNDVVDERLGTNGPYTGPLTSNSLDLGTGNDIAILGFNTQLEGVFGRAPSETFVITGGQGTDVVYLTSFGVVHPEDQRLENGKLFVSDGAGGPIDKLFASFSGVEQIVDIQADRVFTFKAGDFTEGRVEHAATAAKLNLAGSILAEDFTGNSKGNIFTGGGGADRFFGKGGIDTVVLPGRPEEISFGTFLGFTSVVDGVTGLSFNNSRDPQMLSVFVANDIEKLKFLAGPGSDDDITFNLKIVQGLSAAGAQTGGNDLAIFDNGLAKTAALKMLGGDDYVLGGGEIKSLDGGVGNDIMRWTVAGAKVSISGGDGDEMSRCSAPPRAMRQWRR